MHLSLLDTRIQAALAAVTPAFLPGGVPGDTDSTWHPAPLVAGDRSQHQCPGEGTPPRTGRG